jgi:hypothetical protein
LLRGVEFIIIFTRFKHKLACNGVTDDISSSTIAKGAGDLFTFDDRDYLLKGQYESI